MRDYCIDWVFFRDLSVVIWNRYKNYIEPIIVSRPYLFGIFFSSNTAIVHILKLIPRQTVYQSESFQTTAKMCPLQKGWVSHGTDHTFITFALDGKPSRLAGWPLSWTTTLHRSSKINYEFLPLLWNAASGWHTSSCRDIFMGQVGNLS